MNKECFHNQLALNLGYQRIVNDKSINISIDGFSKPVCYKTSEGLNQNDLNCLSEDVDDDIKIIIDVVHQAYIQANKPF